MPTMWAHLSPGIKGFGSVSSESRITPSGDPMDATLARRPAPTISLLAHSLFQCSLSFFLFSFQVHEKTILVPLLPATLLMVASAPTVEGGDWEWGVLLNNVGCFSLSNGTRPKHLAVQDVFPISVHGDAAKDGDALHALRQSSSPASSTVRRRNTSALPPMREEGPSIVDLNEPSL
ncbi:Glucosyltransferase-like protein [Serendipita sp. 399]|nr:Glucosyltransferase-like protein [Serendipita sp. 399]